MIIIDSFQQGSDSWFKEKAGKPGASSFNRIVTSKGDPSKQRQDYLYQLVGEHIIGRQEEGYTSHAMEIGLTREEEARNFYEFIENVTVKQVGLIYKDESRSVLCSPDGLMNDCGLEIKCPLLKTHVKYLVGNKLPTEYIQQVQGSMYVTGFKKWVFMSYYPQMDPLI